MTARMDSAIWFTGVASPKKPIKIESTGGGGDLGHRGHLDVPTASEDVLGTGKYSPGPPRWLPTWGRNGRWEFFRNTGGPSAATATVAMSASPIFSTFSYYAPPWDPKAQWRIGMSPNISINWTAEGDKATLPVGMGIGRLFEIGRLPVRIQLEVDYSVIHPHDKIGSRWDFRIYFTPVIPTFLF